MSALEPGALRTPDVHLAIGPLNVAGQGFQWAEACRKFDGVDSVSFSGARRSVRVMTGQSHRRILHHRFRPTFAKTAWVRMVLRHATHFLDESFATITGDQRTETLTGDLPWLRDAGVSVAVVFHGSDIRSPSRHLESHPDSFFRLMDPQTVVKMERATHERRVAARESGLPLFVSTPDLLLDLPSAAWLPLALDTTAWQSGGPALARRRLRVLHLPSRRVPPIKGTSFIDPVMKRLTTEGVVDYVSPVVVAHEHLPDLIRSVDVVIDQLLTGSYGVAAIEAMAAQRLVLGHVNADVRALVDHPIPIVDCAPSSLENQVRKIAADPGRYVDTARAGAAFVEALHSGAGAANVLASAFLGTRG